MNPMRELQTSTLPTFPATCDAGVEASIDTVWKPSSPPLAWGSQVPLRAPFVLGAAFTAAVGSASAAPSVGPSLAMDTLLDPPLQVLATPRMPWPSVADFVAALRVECAKEQREDGVAHPADALVEKLARTRLAAPWLTDALRQLQREPQVLSELLRGMAALPRQTGDMLLLVPSGLVHPSFVVRESAVRIIESWRMRDLADALRKFANRERVQWLADYMRTVSAELTA